MPSLTVRNLSDETHRALKQRATRHGRSTEAEVRSILDAAVKVRVGVGSTLASIGRRLGGVELQIERSRSPVSPADFK